MMRPVWRLLCVFGLLSAPAVALAASGEPSASDRAMQFALLLVNSWIASRIGPLETWAKSVEKRLVTVEARR